LKNILPGPDHAASLEPNELKQLVKSIRLTEQMLGNPEKTPTASELPNKTVARKSIHAARTLKQGAIVEETDLQYLRPGNGISPMEYRQLTGKKVKHNIEKGDLLKWEDFE
jgi:N,N'-diacetyllegionaminate synthase